MMRSALPSLAVCAAAAAPPVLAHATTYVCDSPRTLCAPSGACIRDESPLSFVVDDINHTAAMITADRYSALTPTSSPADGLRFQRLGRAIQFQTDDTTGLLQVSLDVTVQTEPAVAHFVCAEDIR